MDNTRVIELRPGQRRDHADNVDTFVGVESLAEPRPFEELFVAHYARIRDVALGYRRAGVAIIAVDNDGVAASACVGAKIGRPNSAIVGRHGMADLFLEADPGLSLRHLAVILHPRQHGADLRYRVLDLRTTTCFVDERGRRLEALEAEGPVFVRCGRHALFFLPTEDEATPWPEDPHAGFACIPERIFFDDAPAEPDRWVRRRQQACWVSTSDGHEARLRRTLVETTRGPSRAQRRLLADDDEPLGELRISSKKGESTLVVGRHEAREGILLGRYERCDTEGLPVLASSRISRVHALVVELNGVVHLVDTASTNGVWRDEEQVRLTPLQPGDRLDFARGVAQVRWTTT